MAKKSDIKKILIEEWENRSTFVDKLRDKYDNLWQKLENHPFLVEIAKGKLPMKKFLAYGKENQYYISELRAAAGAGAMRATSDSERQIMIAIQHLFPLDLADYSFGQLAIAAGIPEKEIKAILDDPDFPLPATRAYTDYMFKEFATKPAGIAIASWITCPWTYSAKEIGGLSCAKTFSQALAKHYGLDKKVADKYTYDYEDWDKHNMGIKALKDTVNNFAKDASPSMLRILESNFRRDIEFEYMFWDMAYRHDPDKKRKFGDYF